MKKIYSTIMLLAMMVAALSFAACSSDDDENGGSDSGSDGGDYIQVTLNGKTYSDKILNFYYLQVDLVGKDSDNNPLTLTYDAVDHFKDKYGFQFMFGVVHYSRMSELLASSAGTYGCAKNILSKDYYNNLTFWSTLDIDYNEYNWESGSHEVKSIKEVNGKVQIEGNFTQNYKLGSEKCTVTGNYRITIP